ncbi:MAG: type IV pilus twitching motility protein PilT [candidate division Zixibacteria bacterium]|nr:type IV pilus twitching motility protein PilT [candidate division Zixibacteria bacterium]
MAKIDQLLKIVKEAKASDLHLGAGSVPIIRVNGLLEKTRASKLTNEGISQLIFEILTDKQIKQFESTGDLDFSYGIENVARFRINIYQTFHGIGVAIRLITDEISDLMTLGFNDSVVKLTEHKSGIVLVTGPTNSGKTTTLAAMVDHINTNFSKHIVTLEDPIEMVHTNKNSMISQRQIGLHSESFPMALRAALREDPDVILVGEMRDTETISLAVTAAEVGLLVLGTLHTGTASSTVNRVIDVFPPEQQQQIRIMLADALVGVVSQQLVRKVDNSGRTVAFELLTRTTSLASLIRDSKTHQIPTTIQTGRKQGMQLLDNHLRELVDKNVITSDEALRVATNPSQFTAGPKTSKLDAELIRR